MTLRNASLIFFVLLILASATFVFTANALNPGTNLPANTGFAARGQFPQGVQTGSPGQFQAGNFPGQMGSGQAQGGAGITVGDMPRTPLGGSSTGPVSSAGTIGGGPGTCYCIRAPCNCGGTGSAPIGGPGSLANQPGTILNQPALLNQPLQAQQLQAQPMQSQNFQAQGYQPLAYQAGRAGNLASGNAVPMTATTGQF